MTVPSAVSRSDFIGNGATATFSFPFRIFAAADLLVVQKNTVTGVATTLVYGVDYTVPLASVNNASGGTITLTAGVLATGQSLSIINAPSATQPTSYVNQGGYFPQSEEDSFDRVTKVDLWQQDQLNRALMAPPADQGAAMTLPTKELRKGFLLGFDGTTGNPVAMASASTPVSSLMAPVVAAPSTAAGRLAMGPWGDALVTATGGSTARTLAARFAERINVLDRGVTGDGSTNDTTALAAVFSGATTGSTIVIPAGTYVLNGCITLSAVNNVTIVFDGATFNVGDSGTAGTITNAASGKIGFLFKNCAHLRMFGQARLIGQGVAGTTSLAGMVFDTCAYADVQAEFYYENMAAGRFVFWCDESRFGNITAKTLNGLQTFEGPPTNPAGSAEVVIGCRYSQFGEIVAFDVLKSVRYLSVALTGGSAAIDNQYCKLGPISASALAGSVYAQLTQVRSAVNCNFAPLVGAGFVQGVAIQQYTGDEAWSGPDGNVFQHIGGTFLSTAAAVDCALTQETTSGNAAGSNKVLSISANCAGEFGVTCTTGKMSIRDMEISGGCDYPVFAYGCTLQVGRLVTTGQHKECVLFGLSCHLAIDFADFGSGSKNGASGVIQFSNSYGSGSFGTVSIGRIRYNNNASGTNYNYLYVDLTNGFEKVTIGHVEAITAPVSAHVRSGSDEFFVRRGLYSATGIPTTQAYSRGTVLWNSAPAAAGTPGWVCTTAGTPGTWKAMANVAA